MPQIRVSAQLQPQHSDWSQMRDAVVGRRGARRRLPLQLGPLLPAQRPAGRQALRGADRARRDGRGDRAGRARLARDLQQLPQPGVPRRRAPHARPHLRRPRDPRHRRRLVREGLRRVRLRVRHGRLADHRAPGGAAADRGPARQAQPAARPRHPGPDRRRRREAHAEARRAPRGHLARVRRRRRVHARRTRSSSSTAATRAATRRRSSARGASRAAAGTRTACGRPA